MQFEASFVVVVVVVVGIFFVSCVLVSWKKICEVKKKCEVVKKKVVRSSWNFL